MNRSLHSFVLLLTCLFFFSGSGLFGQGRDTGDENNNNEEEVPSFLKGQRNSIDDLDDNYCSSGSYDDIYLDPADIPAETQYVKWEIRTNVDDDNHNEWIDEIGTAPQNGVRFYPDRVESEYLDARIFFQYYFVDDQGMDIGSGYDYTYVRKSADVYDFGEDSELCEGASATLILDGSETGFEYQLYRDGIEVAGEVKAGTGSSINFEVSTAGTYTVSAQRTSAPLCIMDMSGSAVVTIYPNPVPDPQSNGPVCQNEEIQLYDGNPSVSGYVYTWNGPGLPTAGQTGHSITVSDLSVIGTPGTYSYDLTITDTNNPTNCEVTQTVSVTVNEAPEIVDIDNSGPACEGANVSFTVTVSGGTGPYSFAWSGPNGFSSTDQNPILSNVSISDAGDYEVIVTDANGCGSAVGTTSLTVNENPSIDAVSNDGPVCEGGTVNLSVSVSGGTGP
ncbi:hypothetical protein ACT29H_08665, partial [Thermophagus sp. OGC60D27]